MKASDRMPLAQNPRHQHVARKTGDARQKRETADGEKPREHLVFTRFCDELLHKGQHAVDDDLHAGGIGMDAVGLVELGIERHAVQHEGIKITP